MSGYRQPLITLLVNGELYGLFAFPSHPWAGSPEYETAGPSTVWTGHASHFTSNGFASVKFHPAITGTSPVEALAKVVDALLAGVPDEAIVNDMHRRWLLPKETDET